MGTVLVGKADRSISCRVAGVAVEEDHVLLHRLDRHDYWTLPGGHVEGGETSAETLKREMLEEIDTEVTVGRLLWLIENFYERPLLNVSPSESEAIACHEIGIYREMRFPVESALTKPARSHKFRGASVGETFNLEFRWFERTDLADLDVRPVPLKELLAGSLPTIPSLIVNVD